jgi:cellulose biosynthesis protein BcsQ
MRVALAAATGGAGATRLSIECGAVLARDGQSAAVLDAAYGTQGLADHVPGRVDPDLTALTLGDDPIEAGLVDLDVDAPGRLAACPSRAPFERIARAQSAEAARGFEARVDEVAARFDHVLLDVPPVASNPAVAALNAADRVAAVVPASERGAAALPRLRDRFADIGIEAVATLLDRAGDDDHGIDATVAVPTSEVEAPADVPVAATGESPFVAAVADAAEALCDVAVDVDAGSGGFGPLG